MQGGFNIFKRQQVILSTLPPNPVPSTPKSVQHFVQRLPYHRCVLNFYNIYPLFNVTFQLVDDPIFIQIDDLEQRHGKPAEFTKVKEAMIYGKTGSLKIDDAIRSIPKGDFQDGVVLATMPSTYYYASLSDSVYAFAFNLADSDAQFRYPYRPKDTSDLPENYFHNIEGYDSKVVRKVCQCVSHY